MHNAAEPFEVVGDDKHGADADERQQPDATHQPAVDGSTGDREGRDDRQCAVTDAGAQRVTVAFIEGVRADTQPKKEAEQCPAETLEPDRVHQRGADGDVRQVPRGVRRVQQRQPIAPATGAAATAVERRPDGVRLVRRAARAWSPTSPNRRRSSSS